MPILKGKHFVFVRGWVAEEERFAGKRIAEDGEETMKRKYDNTETHEDGLIIVVGGESLPAGAYELRLRATQRQLQGRRCRPYPQ